MTSGLRGIGGCLAAAALIALGAGCGDDDSGPATAAAAPETFFGVVPQGPLSEEEFERMGEGRVGTLRVALPWTNIDPTPEEDYDFSSTDGTVLGAARNGIQVLPLLYGTPTWDAQELDGHDCVDDCPTHAPVSEEALQAWQEFVTAAINRYGPEGTLWEENPDVEPVPIHSWQIWNEQNSSTFWKPRPDQAAYAELVDAAEKAIHAEDEHASVVLGGMFGTPPDGETAWSFLRQLYEIEGPEGSFDAVAAHPYAAHMEKVRSQVELIRDEVERADDTDAALWITEIGWASSGPDVPLNRGPEGQAEELESAFEYFLERRERWNIAGVTWYSWRDTSDMGICDWCGGSGLFPVDSLEPKPSWEAFTALTGGE